MIESVESLLIRWGHHQSNPDLDVAIGCPLGAIDEARASVAGHRVLSLVECHAVADREVLVVEAALQDIERMGGIGRQLAALAVVRYAQRRDLPLVEQQQRLGMSRDVYLSRLRRLRVEVAARWPALLQRINQLESDAPAARQRQAWLTQVRKAALKAYRQRERGKRAAARAGTEG